MVSTYIPRTAQAFILATTQQYPAILMTGPRQVGKTTFLQHLEPDRTYVSLEDMLLLQLAKTDPVLFLQRFPPPVLIDEIQYAPELLPYIKMDIDKQHQPGAYWLTCSQQFHLMQSVSESLAGRMAVVHLQGLSLKESLGHAEKLVPFIPTNYQQPDPTQVQSGLHEIFQTIWRGAFPFVALDPSVDKQLFYSSYLQTYVQRDVKNLANVGDELAFVKFIRAAAARTGQLLNMNEIARDTGIAVNTAKRWLSILQASGLVYLLEPYHNNITKRIIKTPKLYFLDTGLCTYLTEWTSSQTLESGAMAGAIFETWVVAELLKSWWHNGLRPPFYFYRDKDQKEIDLIIEQDGMLYPIEIKKTGSPNKDMVKHFSVLNKLNIPVGKGALICLVRQMLPLTKDIIAIPIDDL